MRQEFSAKTKMDAFKRSGDICECHRIPGMVACGRPLKGQPIFYEHIIQCEISNDNSLENCAVLTKTCWRLKTDKQDLPVIAKVKRVERKNLGIKKPSRFPGSKNSRFKRKINGTVVMR